MANSRAGTRKEKMSLGYLVVKESEEELSGAGTERKEEKLRLMLSACITGWFVLATTELENTERFGWV